MDSIYTEVRKFVQDRVEAGVITRVEWLTSEYLAGKSDISGGDVPFYRVCALAHVNDVMKRCVGKYDAKPSKADQQLILPGFDHLQKAYTVSRDGAMLLVPVDLLTNEELLARAEEYDAMAKGCRDHAREIREFVSTREAVAA